MRRLAAAFPFLFLLASPASHSEDAAASLGEQRAAASQLTWEIRDAGHPVLGPIRFAHTTSAVVTPVGGAKVFSNVYLSCEKTARTIAIELTNQTAPDDPGGLAPATMPRLVCVSPASAGGGKTVQQVIEATWQVNALGDAMARGLRPSSLRACAALGIVENVTLPKGWARASLPVAFEISPYARELDAIFATCGEVSAYVSRASERSPPPSGQARRSPSAVGEPPPAWKSARTVATGATNVRAAPNLHSAVVVRLDSGARILVLATGTEWWRAKSRTGHKFEGYIRADRLVFE